MSQIQTERTPETKEKASVVRLLIAAAIVAVVGIAIVLLTQGDDEVPVATDPTPITVVEATPTTTVPTTTAPIPAEALAPENLAVAQSVVDAMWEPGGDALSAIPWTDESVGQEVIWLSAFGAAVNPETVDSSCDDRGTRIICQVMSKDDITKAIDPEAVNHDTFDLYFDGTASEVTIANWINNTTGELGAFYAWTFVPENSGGAFQTGGLCHVDSDQPAECAALLLGLTEVFLSSQDS